jgi:hypothetical protein
MIYTNVETISTTLDETPIFSQLRGFIFSTIFTTISPEYLFNQKRRNYENVWKRV